MWYCISKNTKMVHVQQVISDRGYLQPAQTWNHSLSNHFYPFPSSLGLHLNRIDFFLFYTYHSFSHQQGNHHKKRSSSSISERTVPTPSHLIKRAVYGEIVAGAGGVCDKSGANLI